jgi:hypothetical protein
LKKSYAALVVLAIGGRLRGRSGIAVVTSGRFGQFLPEERKTCHNLILWTAFTAKYEMMAELEQTLDSFYRI